MIPTRGVPRRYLIEDDGSDRHLNVKEHQRSHVLESPERFVHLTKDFLFVIISTMLNTNMQLNNIYLNFLTLYKIP